MNLLDIYVAICLPACLRIACAACAAGGSAHMVLTSFTLTFTLTLREVKDTFPVASTAALHAGSAWFTN